MKNKRDNGSIGMSTMENGRVNLAYDGEEFRPKIATIEVSLTDNNEKSLEVAATNEEIPEERMQWGSGIEFLMSCIAMSVGLGNIWRFPFTAFENGGGAFLIPYIVVLVVVGRPLYYLEMVLGQFTSKGCVEVWQLAPLLKGVGYGQIVANICILTYYCALMCLTLFYMSASFTSELPWAKCKPHWPDCFDSVAGKGNLSSRFNRPYLRSSSEMYFKYEVLHEKYGIEDGIGLPDWKLTLCLAASWTMMFLILVKGIKSSGKVAYFLAMFPYVVLTALLIRGCTLPGAMNGILYFLTPQWGELLNPKVWYAAITQCFFSLGVCFGALITYSSYNDFRHNIHRDAMIVAVMDTGTSFIAGITIFAILGNLAHESGTTDIAKVTQGGAGLAFISYPDAIAKFDFVPQLFSVLFFFMLFTLAIGSAVSMHSAVVTMITDNFPNLKYWKIALGTSFIGFLSGLIYVTPGGQHMLTLVDYFAGSFSIFVLAAIEAIGINWIYGLDNFCNDIEFMLNMKVGVYWRLCWGLFTPVSMLVILIYSIATVTPLKYGDYTYPTAALACGWLLLLLGIIQIPLWAIIAICKNRREPVWQMMKSLLKPSSSWGPLNPSTKKEWEQMKRKKLEELDDLDETPTRKMTRVLCSCHRSTD